MPHDIDVRLQKVLAFGDRAGAVRPLDFSDRNAFHRTVARANWQVDGHSEKLPTNSTNRRHRWRIKLKGTLRITPGAALTPSYEEPGVSMAIIVRILKLDGDAGWTDVLHSTL